MPSGCGCVRWVLVFHAAYKNQFALVQRIGFIPIFVQPAAGQRQHNQIGIYVLVLRIVPRKRVKQTGFLHVQQKLAGLRAGYACNPDGIFRPVLCIYFCKLFHVPPQKKFYGFIIAWMLRRREQNTDMTGKEIILRAVRHQPLPRHARLPLLMGAYG